MRTCSKSSAALLALCLGIYSALAQGVAFTYQGRLSDNNNPANGLYDLRFRLYDAAANGSLIAGPITNSGVTISVGLFTVPLDFGNAFDGGARWIEMGVRPNNAGAFTILSPRQPVTAVPYAATAGQVTAPDVARLNVANTAQTATGVPTVTSGFIIGASVTSGGSGYGSPPVVTVNASTGSGAAITATVNNGTVVSLMVQNAGSGYSAGATLSIAPPPSNAYQIFSGTNFFTGANSFGGTNNSFTGSFAGNGIALTNLSVSAANVVGSLPASQLSGTLGSAQLQGTYANALTFNNSANSFSGNGSGLKTLNPTNLSPGTAGINISGTAATASTANGVANGSVTAAGIAAGQAVKSLNGLHDAVQLAAGANVTLATNGSTLQISASNGGGGWGLTGNAGTTPGVNFIGTTDNQPFEYHVNGQRALRLEPTPDTPNVIGGYSGNSVQAGLEGVTISGGGTVVPLNGLGQQNTVTGNGYYGAIGGGYNNSVFGYAGVIGGGSVNAVADFSGVSSGQFNAAFSSFSSVSGGGSNIIWFTAGYSFIGGGWQNTIERTPLGDFALNATIGGGEQNLCRGNRSTVGGGYRNTSSGNSGTVGGGQNNVSSGASSTVGGGSDNLAQGISSTVPGGSGNQALVAGTFAAGNHAQANHAGAFVLADSAIPPVSSVIKRALAERDTRVPAIASTAENQFTARFTGGFRLVTAVDGATPTAGAELYPGSGSWNSLSDRRAKENLLAIDSQSVLDKVTALPLSTWNYRTEEKSVRHIGPMAQDFRDAFGLGENETTISTIDAEGVALAAIQGLNQKLESENQSLRGELSSRDAQLRSQQQQIGELANRLNAIEEQMAQSALDRVKALQVNNAAGESATH